MRNREVIEREIYRARDDLEASIAELKHVVAEKVDVKARARVAFAKGKAAARDALEAGKVGAVDALNAAKERPVLVGAIVGGVIAAVAIIYIGRQKDWW